MLLFINANTQTYRRKDKWLNIALIYGIKSSPLTVDTLLTQLNGIEAVSFIIRRALQCFIRNHLPIFNICVDTDNTTASDVMFWCVYLSLITYLWNIEQQRSFWWFVWKSCPWNCTGRRRAGRWMVATKRVSTSVYSTSSVGNQGSSWRR